MRQVLSLLVLILRLCYVLSLKTVPAQRFGDCPLPRLSSDYCAKVPIKSTCRIDSDCKNIQDVCCSNGCAFTCVKPLFNTTVSPHISAVEEKRKLAEGSLKCPPVRYTSLQKCPKGVFRLACKAENECRPLGLHCCNNGCSGVCVKLVPSDGKSENVLGYESNNKTDTIKSSYYEGCPAIRFTPDSCARIMFKFTCKSDLDCKSNVEKCCYNGCVDVCATIATINENIVTKATTSVTDTSKPNTSGLNCPPPTLKSEQCPKKGTFKHLCLSDSSCKSGLQCCSNGCIDMCMKPIATDIDLLPPKTDITKIQVVSPVCPVPKYTRVDCARMRFRSMCNGDSECKTGQKCCNNGCVGYCVDKIDTDVKLTTAVTPDTTIKITSLQIQCPPPVYSNEDCEKIKFKSMCSTDDQCNISGQKCCNNGCAGTCISSDYIKNVELQKNTTTRYEVTKSPSMIKSQCPPPILTPDICESTRFQSMCVNDDDCKIIGQKCCSNGCVGVCLNPNPLTSNNDVKNTTSAPTKNTVKVSTSNDQCPPAVFTPDACMTMRFRSMCSIDSDCNTIGQKCCSNGCVNNCVNTVQVKTIEQLTPNITTITKVETKSQTSKEKCPAPILTRDDCTRMRFKHICQVDSDCDSSDEICCNNGCVNYCFIQSIPTTETTVMKIIENTTMISAITTSSNAVCPGSIYIPTQCKFVRFASCDGDASCSVGMKCCNNGCGKSCMEPSCTSKKGVCPGKNINCFWSMCKSDCDCPGTQKCCYGCMCTEPE